MVSDIGALLVEIDKKSFDIYKSFCSEVRNPFRFDNRHRTLDEFSEALELYERLEEMLNSGTNPSSFESDIVCAFYSALAFRIVDSSLYTEEKITPYEMKWSAEPIFKWQKLSFSMYHRNPTRTL